MGATLESVASRAWQASVTKRLVIVADNSLVVQAIRTGFRESGDFTLVGYANPRRTAVRTILEAKPDVILLDANQSERALELIRSLRSEDDDVAIFVLSMQLDAGWLDEVFDAGATAVISRSTRSAALATLVRETLDGRIVHPRPSGPSSVMQTPAAAAEDLPLTNRELEILRLVASGSTNGDVARQLWVSEQTVKFHLRNTYRKLEVANRTQASHFAHVTGLIQRGPDSGVAGRPELRLA